MKPIITLLLFLTTCALASIDHSTQFSPAVPPVTLVTVAVDLSEMADDLELSAVNCRKYAQLAPEGAPALNAQADAYAAAAARIRAEQVKIVVSLPRPAQ